VKDLQTTEIAATLALVNSDSGKELTRRAGEIFSNLLGPATEQLGLTLGDCAAYYRLKRLVALGEKAQNLLRGKRISNDPNLGRVLPIIQIASMESDEDLHTRWAALLANVLHDPSTVHPSYIEILKQLTSEEAQWLDRIFDEVLKDEVAYNKKVREEMPGYAGEFNFRRRVRTETREEATEVMQGNLQRLGLVDREKTDTDEEGLLTSFDSLFVSEFGRAFVRACRVA